MLSSCGCSRQVVRLPRQRRYQLLPPQRHDPLGRAVVVLCNGNNGKVDPPRLHHPLEMGIVVYKQPQRDIRKPGLEGRQQLGHQRQPPEGDPHAEESLLFQRRDAGRRRVLDFHHRPGRLEIHLPRLRGHQSRFFPEEQRCSQFAFQLQKVLAQGGLGDEQLLRRVGHALLPGNLQNILRVLDVHPFCSFQQKMPIGFVNYHNRFYRFDFPGTSHYDKCTARERFRKGAANVNSELKELYHDEKRSFSGLCL